MFLDGYWALLYLLVLLLLLVVINDSLRSNFFKLKQKENSAMLTDQRLELYKKLIVSYENYKENENNFKKMKDKVRDSIHSMMHEDQTNNVKVFIEGLDKEMECTYIDKVNKRVDYVMLSEYVDDEAYDDIVSSTKSSYLSIKPAKVKTDKVKKPIEEEYGKTLKAEAPKGKILR